MTFEFFEKQMDRLSGLKFRPLDLRTHWAALKDMPERLFEAAVSKAAPECDEFPAPIRLREFADMVRSRVMAIPQSEDRSAPADEPLVVELPNGAKLHVTKVWKYYCEDCCDVGWRSYWCGDPCRCSVDTVPLRSCGRYKTHAPHGWSSRCPCVATNPDIVRRREHQAQTGARGSERQQR